MATFGTHQHSGQGQSLDPLGHALNGRRLTVGSVSLALPRMAQKIRDQGIRCSSLLKLLLDGMT
jgi:hypothetical protein